MKCDTEFRFTLEGNRDTVDELFLEIRLGTSAHI